MATWDRVRRSQVSSVMEAHYVALAAAMRLLHLTSDCYRNEHALCRIVKVVLTCSWHLFLAKTVHLQCTWMSQAHRFYLFLNFALSLIIRERHTRCPCSFFSRTLPILCRLQKYFSNVANLSSGE